VYESAETSAELARRMQGAGNFNRLARAREHAFYADATTRLATARHHALATREALVRLVGLDEAQARRLQLPERLPDLPRQALAPEQAARQGSDQRLDLQLARAQFDAATQAQGLGRFTSLTDIELSLIRQSHFETDGRARARGLEIGLRLPLFDSGELLRQNLSAQTLAAVRQLEAAVRSAGSHLRESYSAYRTAHDIARHMRDEVVPLRRTIAEENLLRYNAMLIGVFELMADAREQVATVMAAIEAEQQFWLADAALQASLIGKPVGLQIAGPAAASAASPAGH
jgi:outer membrane protein TolC